MQNVKLHDGLPSTYWLTVAGYVAAGLLMFGVFITGYLNSESEAGFRAMGMTIGLLLGVYSLAGTVSYVAIFKDSAYIRSARSRWKPCWWRYIGAGVGAPVVVYLGSTFVTGSDIAAVLGFGVHAITAFAASTAYLYHRHQQIGVP